MTERARLEPEKRRPRLAVAAAVICAAWAISLLVTARAAAQSPSKATAAVDVLLRVLDAVKPGRPVRISLHAVPHVDAPSLELVWKLSEGVALATGSLSWKGQAKAGRGVDHTVSVVLADSGPRELFGGAILSWPDGTRQVKSRSLILPAGAAAKQTPSGSLARGGRGQAIVEHLVVPATQGSR